MMYIEDPAPVLTHSKQLNNDIFSFFQKIPLKRHSRYSLNGRIQIGVL